MLIVDEEETNRAEFAADNFSSSSQRGDSNSLKQKLLNILNFLSIKKLGKTCVRILSSGLKPNHDNIIVLSSFDSFIS